MSTIHLVTSSLAILLASTSNVCSAFLASPQRNRPVSFSRLNLGNSHNENLRGNAPFDPFQIASSVDPSESTPKISSPRKSDAMKATSVFLAALAASPAVSNANDSPDWGLFEGKTGSIIHPIMMGSMFLFSINTAIKGFNWRRQRTMGDEISALKKQLPKLPEGAKTLGEAINMGKEAGEDVSKFQAAMGVQGEIDDLTAERKELSGQNNRDKHYNQGALLAFIGTAFAIEGPLNTYARAGKLFPGPHLYAGAGLVVCWAAASACVPFMQKGNDTARSIHIGANSLGLGLFAWQITSGIPILTKVWELTKWP